MKTILLTIVTVALSLSAVKAQTRVYNASDTASLLTQLGIPWVYVDQYDVGNATQGFVSFGQNIGEAQFFGSGTSFGLYKGSDYERSNESGARWGFAYQTHYYSLTNSTAGQPIFLKVKADGTLKPVQINNGGNGVAVFDTNGYYYRIDTAEYVYPPGSQGEIGLAYPGGYTGLSFYARTNQ